MKRCQRAVDRRTAAAGRRTAAADRRTAEQKLVLKNESRQPIAHAVRLPCRFPIFYRHNCRLLRSSLYTLYM